MPFFVVLHQCAKRLFSCMCARSHYSNRKYLDKALRMMMRGASRSIQHHNASQAKKTPAARKTPAAKEGAPGNEHGRPTVDPVCAKFQKTARDPVEEPMMKSMRDDFQKKMLDQAKRDALAKGHVDELSKAVEVYGRREHVSCLVVLLLCLRCSLWVDMYTERGITRMKRVG